MSTFSLKKTIFNGIALALPLGVVAYVFIRLTAIAEKIISPLAKKLGVDTIFGEVTLTVLAILVLLILAFILGLLMMLPFVSSIRKQLEITILKIVPSLNHFKIMADEKLNIENATVNWMPVLIYFDDAYLPAYIIEETNEWITFAKVKAPSTEPDEISIVKKTDTKYIIIPMSKMRQYNKQFGKGYISLLDNSNE